MKVTIIIIIPVMMITTTPATTPALIPTMSSFGSLFDKAEAIVILQRKKNRDILTLVQ